MNLGLYRLAREGPMVVYVKGRRNPFHYTPGAPPTLWFSVSDEYVDKV